MKAIIISDDSRTIEVIDKTLIDHGFDTIIYRWLLKALDNIEEIRPNLVIVSVNEYPRHWKTLAQFITSGIGGESTKVLLLCQTPLSEDERKKASALGVKGFFTGIDEDGLSQLKSFLGFFFPREEALVPEPVENKYDDENEYEDEDMEVPTVSAILAQNKKEEEQPVPQPAAEVVFNVDEAVLLFTNPHSGKMITGNVSSYKNRIVEFVPESRSNASDMKAGDMIDCLTFELDSKVQNYTASVISKTDKILIKLLEEING